MRTLLGRRLALKASGAMSPKVRAEAQRCATSMYLAASAAEAVRAAAVAVHRATSAPVWQPGAAARADAGGTQQPEAAADSAAQLVVVSGRELVWRVSAGDATGVLRQVRESVGSALAAKLGVAVPFRVWLWHGPSLDLLTGEGQ